MRRSNGGEFLDAKILVVDDEEHNLRLAKQVLTMAGYNDVKTLQDSRQAVDAIVRDGPDLVLLDVHMPHMDGHEVLEKVAKRLPADAFVPILMCTSDNSVDSRQRALKLGANDFIVKPYDQTELLLRVRNFLRMRLLHLSVQQANATLEHRVQVRTHELVEARGEAFFCLTRALEFRGDSLGGRSKRVASLSERIARAMGIEDAEVEMIGLIAPLHDLGKIGLPDALLMKAGSYSDAEEAELRRHTKFGEAIIGSCNSPILRELRLLATHHHEKWDGTGYPNGMREDEIPIPSRIVAVADMYDGLTTGKAAKPRAEAKAEVAKLSGSSFDPAVIEAFLKVV